MQVDSEIFLSRILGCFHMCHKFSRSCGYFGEADVTAAILFPM